jgi:hypothetical protein
MPLIYLSRTDKQVQAGEKYVVTQVTVRGGEAVRRKMGQVATPLSTRFVGMAVVARVTGYSLLTAALGAVLGLALFSQLPYNERNSLSFVLACLGTLVGVVVGAAGEMVTPQRRYAEMGHRKQMSKTYEGLD